MKGHPRLPFLVFYSYLLGSTGALFRHQAPACPLPCLSWRFHRHWKHAICQRSPAPDFTQYAKGINNGNDHHRHHHEKLDER